MLVRLQKFLAEAGVGSRRHCETLIQEGRITVNGSVVSVLGTRIEPGVDKISVDGKPVATERKVYVAIHKPAGYICTSEDTHGRQRVLDLIPANLPRLYTVGRLDYDTEGLLFLTNDGTFSLRLTHPRYKMPKTYRVEVEGRLVEGEIAQLLRGVSSEGEQLRAEKIFDVRPAGARTKLQLVLCEGRKRQVRRMLAAVGHPVTRLTRWSVGPIQLGNLKPGQWRYLSDEEIRKLNAD